MTGDHPSDWVHRCVEADALREAASELDAKGYTEAALWLDERADKLEQR